MARLSHNARVASVLWLEDDSGIISLGEDGMISRWSRTVRLLSPLKLQAFADYNRVSIIGLGPRW